MGEPSGDEKGSATLQKDSTYGTCNDRLYFSNAETITQHFGDHWGVSSRQKEGNEKTQFGTMRTYGTLSHDSLATSMFGSAQSCNFLPRKQVRKNDRPRPRTFLRFRSYQEAHGGS